jgi:hypothetical protein
MKKSLFSQVCSIPAAPLSSLWVLIIATIVLAHDEGSVVCHLHPDDQLDHEKQE